MQIHVKAVNLELTGSMETYAQEKLAKLEKFLAPHQNESATVNVMLIFGPHDTKSTKDKCHITVTGLGQGHTVHAETEAPDMHVAIDACVQKAEEQLRREKDRRGDHLSKQNAEQAHIPAEELMDMGPVQGDSE